jgi:hypothetical protein
MMKILRFLFFIVLSLLSFHGYSQGELDDQAKIMMKNEKTGLLFLTSNGMGAGYRYGKRINARNQTIYDFDFMNVKHPKEIKTTSSNNSYYSSRSFVYGKKNNFFELKGTIGKQYEIYRKNDKGGISVRYFYAAGPSLGLLKPIFYEYAYNYLTYSVTKTEKFSASNGGTINGRSSFFKGFNELSVVPGLNAKAGFSFEYGREDAIIKAIEVGLGLDVFPRSIPIMANGSNNFFFLNLTAGYRFGKVIDVSDVALTKNRKARWQEMRLNRKIAREQKKKEGNLEEF